VWVASPLIGKREADAAVSVPVRGVGCFKMKIVNLTPHTLVSVPVRGVGCFMIAWFRWMKAQVSVPVRGVGCFSKK